MGLAKTVAVRFPEWGPEFATLMVSTLSTSLGFWIVCSLFLAQECSGKRVVMPLQSCGQALSLTSNLLPGLSPQHVGGFPKRYS